MRKTKDIFIISLICFIILGMFSNVFAADLKTRLDIIQQSAETKYLENDQGYITKSIVDSDEEKGEVTVDLGLSNITNDTTEKVEKYENTEIFIIVNENIATKEEILTEYITYIHSLATKVFDKSSNTKIGIVGMTGTIDDSIVDENGKLITGENDERDIDGTDDNAEIVINFTDKAEDIKNALQNMNNKKISYYTNLKAAVRLANNSFSSNVNKILISLYDNVPSIASGVCAGVSYGGWFSEYRTIEEAVIGKHQKIVSKTKSEILSLKNNNVEFILLRPDDTSFDQEWYNTGTGEKELDFDGSPYVQDLYGTLENPTYGKMYSLNNDDLEKVVTEYIYEDIMEDVRTDIKSAVIKEYFSEDILENFDITFSNEKIDTTKLKENGYIEWNIGDVPGNSTVKLQYTLKIKDMKNEELLDKVLSTSDKTELKYINYLDTETTVQSTSSPKIQLSKIIEPLTATVSYDPTSNTTGKVTATIKTNKPVNKVEGWTISEEGITLTKEYSSNATETVHLVDYDNMEKDVNIVISNIIIEEKDDTISKEKIPAAGLEIGVITMLAITIFGAIILNSKNKKMSDI